MSRPPLARPGGPPLAEQRRAMLRVDHAGEHGAVRIYQGQLAVLRGRRSTARTTAAIEEMARQEESHLAAFDQLLADHAVRPTALRPLWDVAGFALGAATALMGEKAALACTAAVEEVIDDHYAKQAEALEHQDPPLEATLRRFQADERAHRERALADGAAEAPGYRVLSAAIKAGCRLAIKLSEKL